MIDIVAVWASGDGYGSRVVATLRRGTPNLGKVVKVLHDVWRPQFPYEEMWLDTRPSSVEALATAWEIELANEPNELHRALYRELRAVLDGASVEEAQEAR